jgi:Ca2+-binding RTX toxin-like protein
MEILTMDVIKGGKGNDSLVGSEGDDTLKGLAGRDTLDGKAGNDLLLGGDDFDRLWGGKGDDVLLGDGGDDIMNGGAGNDILVWNDGDGNDIMRGGDGYDIAVFNGSVDLGDKMTLTADGEKAIFQRLNLVPINLDVNYTEQFFVDGLGGDDALTVGDLTGTDVKKVIFEGNEGNDFLDAGETKVKVEANGGAGKDTLISGQIDDLLWGGGGDDFLAGEEGDDTMRGGAGDDIMAWDDGDGDDIMRGGEGYDTTVFEGSVDLGDEMTLTADGERAIFQRVNLGPVILDVDDTEKFEVSGLGGNDSLVIKDLSGTDVEKLYFNGNEGNDRLDASKTDIKIVADGGKGDDVLIGGTNNDLLIGGAGSDVLIGGGGKDVLNGGNGGNTYILAKANNSYYDDGKNGTAGLDDYALIEGFAKDSDAIQLKGAAGDYVLGSSPIDGVNGVSIYSDTNGNGILGGSDELIAVVAGVKDLNLAADYFDYV